MGTELNLKEFEWKTIVRPLRIEDYDALVAMQEKCFPGMQTWGRDQIESQLRNFPEGQICVEIEGQLAASSTSLILEYDPNMAWHDWSKVADAGYIRNHNPKGDTLYGIEIMVDPEFRGMKLSRRLYYARKELCREKNLARIIIGGRISGYSQHADKLSAREYIEKVIDKELFDPVLTAQLANGFSLQGLIPDYFPSDSASRGYATFLEWLNLDYRRGLSGVITIRSSPFGSPSCSTRCVPSKALTNWPRSASFSSTSPRTTKATLWCFPSYSRPNCFPASRRHARDRPRDSCLNSHHSTWNSLQRWLSNTT